MMREEGLTGGCQCGAVRYELETAPREVYICHCTECRRQSSSAFGISVIAAASSLQVVQGDPKRWSRATSGGGTMDCFFCPNCGSRLWHRGGDDEDIVSIKGGSLDYPVDVGAAAHIWCGSKLPGIVVPEDVPQFPAEPE